MTHFIYRQLRKQTFSSSRNQVIEALVASNSFNCSFCQAISDILCHVYCDMHDTKSVAA